MITSMHARTNIMKRIQTNYLDKKVTESRISISRITPNHIYTN